MLPSAKVVIGRLTERCAGDQGDIVVRVTNIGSNYDIFVLNSLSEEREVLKKFGTYESR